MNNGFAAKLALSNIRKNRKFYLPYIIAAIGMIAVFYIMSFLADNKGLEKMAGASSLESIMMLGCVVLGLFSIVFIFYINSFLMKRRKTEIGLYNILGMEKKHIGKILFIENTFITIITLIGGLTFGIVFSKLVFMIFHKTMKVSIPLEFKVSGAALVITTTVFICIFLLVLIKNQMSIVLAKPIELLKGSKEGEKEPKSRHGMAILGILFLGTGYYIAITTHNPMSAIFLFFIAIILVIIGTYLVFIAGSISILKMLKKNKKFYYKAKNFTAVSGMLYRMKQNAVGLANICILSTMVLVMISTTVCLRIGIDTIIDNYAPGDLSVTYDLNAEALERKADIDSDFEALCKKEHVEANNIKSYDAFSVMMENKDGQYKFVSDTLEKLKDCSVISVITKDEYEKMTGKSINLSNNQIVYAGGNLPESFKLGGNTYSVKEKVAKFLPKNESREGPYKVYYIVVANENVRSDMRNEYLAETGEDIKNYTGTQHIIVLDTDSSKEELSNLVNRVNQSTYDYSNMTQTVTRSEFETDIYEFSGGFLFLGIFLGTVFTFAAALIIYYKQISEGYYDKDKFEIMQKVGMDKDDIKKSIKTQVLMVFFAPLAMAGIHVIAAFNLIKELLKLFGIYNVALFAGCTVITFAAFALIYGIVYAATAREYYKIVKQ